MNGTADHTSLPSGRVDYVTAAQAFHWFDAAAFQKECQRILKPGGKVLIIYNTRDEEAECTKALADLRREYNPEFHGFSNGIRDGACRAFFNRQCDVLKWDNRLIYDRDGYINRLLSSSYSLKEGDPRFGEYMEAINRLFDRFAVDGRVAVPMNTVVYIG
ncbi:MAG: methyltransferase domain-containing protein [Clostridia bacterium]|nr:methyltransferase domain-containing protein [Clostridia bacterium]